MSNHTNVTVSFPILTILFLIFMTLKLTGVITWSWWWVTAPLWGGFAIIGGIMLVIFLIAVIAALLSR